MADRGTLSRSGRQLFLGLAGSTVLLASLYLLAAGARAGLESPWMSLLVLANIAAAVALAVAVVVQGAHLWRAYREGQLGSRLTSRLATAFIVLTFIPVAIVYYFSVGFLQAGVDSWFDRRIEEPLDRALALGRASLQEATRQASRRLEGLRLELSALETPQQRARLGELARRFGAEELTLFAADGRVVASHSNATDRLLGPRPPRHQWLQAQQGHTVSILDNGPPLHIQFLAPVGEGRILQARYPVPEQLGALASEVERAYSRYHELLFLQRPLKYGFFLILTLVVVQTFLLAAWAALYLARRLMDPLRLLALGTRAVAAGDYGHTLPETRDDELGTLLHSFNDMTRRLARARDEAERHRAELEQQKAYLETVLGHLTSAILTFDRRGRLRTYNRAAGQLLELDLALYLGRTLGALVRDHPHLVPLHEAHARHRRRSGWEVELRLPRRTLLCRAARLPDEAAQRGGTVLVMDDVSALMEAQRQAARTEVAQRLAHEIKNPLTPIQLAAERLERRLRGTLPASEEAVLQRATRTIVAQVDHLRELVGVFSEFAREPRLEKRPTDLNALVDEVAELYRDGEPPVAVERRPAPVPLVLADPGRLRQLLHNLLKNAREAAQQHPEPRILVRTRAEGSGVTLCVEDNGPGIPAELLSQVFEPYLTTKPRGSGLGLAICKRIVEEHGGRILAGNRRGGGARVCVHLPAAGVDRRPEEKP